MPESIANGFLIKQIHDRLEKKSNNDLRAKDLTMMQVSVLLALQGAENQRLSMKELERRFGVAQSTVVGIISRLEQKGLIEALSDAEDKRVKLVHITRSGENCCAEAARHMEEAEEALLQGISEEERVLLNGLLMRMAKNMQ